MEKIAQKLFLPILAGIMLLETSCVKDGDRPCPNYLQIIYDYNMEYVDQFHNQVTFLSIFMFDAGTGKFVREVKQAQSPFPEKYTMEVPKEWFGQPYNIIVWAGLDSESYDFPTLTPGVSTIDDFQLKVKDYEKQLVDRNTALEPLWHGKLSNVTFSDLKEVTYTVPLMKDTKKFRIVAQSFDDNTIITSNDLDIRLFSADGWYDNYNNVLDAKDRDITYLPYYTADDAEVGAIAEMNSLRLMNDERINQLRITDKTKGKVILNISLIKYINALRLLQFSSMPLQEYLDREDEYYILVFLQNAPEGWIATQIKINDWVVREQDVE